MQIYFAPLQGVTDAPFRRLHAARFGGVAKYFTPFISPTQTDNLTNKELRDVFPAENPGLPIVPQILTKEVEYFIHTARVLQNLGWTEVNLNMGCPAGTVTAKGKGAGLLMNLSRLEAFLDGIFARTPLPVSIKMRLGWEKPEEVFPLLELLGRYPVTELILHARTRQQLYGGHPCVGILDEAAKSTHIPLVYNGDLFSSADCLRFAQAHPAFQTVMIGRGLVSDPALAQSVLGGPPLTLGMLRAYHEDLYRYYTAQFNARAALGRMRELGKYVAANFHGAGKPFRQIRKAKTLEAYCDAMKLLFDEYPLHDPPGFVTDGRPAGQAVTDDLREASLIL
ncbi:MAG: tRNA-dihydrouridine synthase family protein [Clostridia bacterium]|nr:tRNA-dihydrouridine synthase family protein [Clostridia bacterium]